MRYKIYKSTSFGGGCFSTKFLFRKNLFLLLRLLLLCVQIYGEFLNASEVIKNHHHTINNSYNDLDVIEETSPPPPPPSSSSSSSFRSNCQRCANGGHSLFSLIILEQRPDCISGHYYALLKNDRCDCQLICARASGQTCHHHQSQSNKRIESRNFQKFSLCDPNLKLFCNEKTKLCEGNLSLVIDHVATDSFSIHWKRPTVVDGSGSGSNPHSSEIFIAKYVPQISEVRFEKIKPTLVDLANINHRIGAKINRLKANTTYIIKVVQDENEELALVTTKPNSTLPKVLVTYRNATSITIVFDDFKPSNDDVSGYAIHYRPDSGFFHKHNQWLIIKSNGTPFFTLTGLKPNTNYKIQVFTWSELDHRQVLSSEIIEANTLNGCVFQNRSFELDEKILEDCEQTCICSEGNVICRKRCLLPMISVKEAQKLNLKKCTFPANDHCCVRCAGFPVVVNINDTNQHHHPDFAFDKPGSCPVMIKSDYDDPDQPCSNECSHDYHCTGVEKCCKNHCGLFSCRAPMAFSDTSRSSLLECPLKCNHNAQCRFIESESAYKCICLTDALVDGCELGDNQSYRQKYSCQFKNQNYSIGQTFLNDCHVCVCTEALEVECKRKCIDYEAQRMPDHCRLIEDLYDPICCKKQICDSFKMAESFNNLSTMMLSTDSDHTITECRYLNETYNVNETFHIGCELRCVCKNGGEVECSPRCFDDNGYNENYCHLKPDPDDPECCKISICDFNQTATTIATTSLFDDHKILIEMAESINSTSIKFRLISFTELFNEANNRIMVIYSKVPINMTSTTKLDDLLWNNETVSDDMLTAVTNDSREIVLKNLEPETDYSVYFKVADEISNTVIVRTFPEGIDHTFKGCFHGSEIIQVGQVFYEGECEYKCVCKEGGIRDCIERCPVFVDMIESDHCHFIPSPDDACCSIPMCDHVEPPSSTYAECIFENGKHYQIGDTWNYGSGCLEKTCTCTLNPKTNVTEIKCKNGCPEIPASVLKPNPNCPTPQLMQTNDPCACPYVVCVNNINPLDLPEKLSQKPKTLKNYCEYKGNKINIGEEFYDGCSAICLCDKSASLDCRPIHCNANFGPHTTKCLEWEIDPLFVPRPPNCCPEPKCKNDGSCSYAGLRFPNYKMIPQELLPCQKRCMCDSGKVHCKNICPEVPDDPPLGLPCPTSMAFRGHLPSDDCCIHWQCREIFRDKIYGKCSYKDKIYKLGEFWDDDETEIHRRCQCKVTNGILHVVCDPGICQPITERFLEPTTECKTPTVVTPKDAIMCPYVICNNTGTQGEEIENVDIVAINATSARVRFTIPSIYVGLLGHAEVHYVTDINIPRSKWNIQKFARPKRLFDIPNIEYHLGNLKPNTTYFLQIEVIIETFKRGPISEIYKIYMPPLPVVTSTTSTTTTSTLPPVIMLDMHMKASYDDVDPNTIKLSWRSFTVQEKKFIDGIQVRYKKAGQDDDEWKYSQILHRDTTHFILSKMEPGITYVIDLIFTSINDITANIISSKPLLVEMPKPSLSSLPLSPKNQDDFHFDFHIYPDDVTIDKGVIYIELKNLPKPIQKYVNVAKIQYQDVKNLDIMYNFVNIDDKSRVSFSNPLPNTRYKLWIDLYLTNGQVVSSNTIDLITNFDEQFYKTDKNSVHSTNGDAHLHHHPITTSRYFFILTIISTIMFLTGTIFLIITCFCLRKHSTAAITKVCISEAAYDNPTYKTFERGDKTSAMVVEDSLVSKTK